MSFNSTLSIAVALVALAIGTPSFAEEIPAGGFAPGSLGTGYSRLMFDYDARGKLHVHPGSLGPRRYVGHRGLDAYAKDVAFPSFSTPRNKSMLSPSSTDYEPDLNSH